MIPSLLVVPFQPHAKSFIGILGTWATNMPGASHYTGFGPIFPLVYCSIAAFLGVTLMSMICYRLVRQGMEMKKTLGEGMHPHISAHPRPSHATVHAHWDYLFDLACGIW